MFLRYLIYFSYDGSNFNGFQKQPNKRCVENMLEDALYSINNYTKTKVTGAGRTDHGVHAFCQCAHFDLNINITLYKLKCALNSLLPPDIHVSFLFPRHEIMFREEIVVTSRTIISAPRPPLCYNVHKAGTALERLNRNASMHPAYRSADQNKEV